MKTKTPPAFDWDNLFVEINSSRKGLSSVDAEARLSEFGYNDCCSVRSSTINSFLYLIRYPVFLFLLFGIGICVTISLFLYALLGLFFALLFIACIFLIDCILQKKSLEHSKQWGFPINVLRDCAWCIKPSREIVVGDVISVSEGEILPADCILLSGDIDTSSLSINAKEIQETLKPGHHISRGTQIYGGKATCLVVSTRSFNVPKHEHVGNIHNDAKNTQKKLIFASTFLICVTVIIAAGSFLTGKTIELCVSAIMCTLVGAIPLPALTIFRINQISISGLLLRKGIYIKSNDLYDDIEKIETLCVEQTGILTRSERSIVDIQTMGEITSENLLWESIVTPSIPPFFDFEVAARKKIAAEGKYFLGWDVLDQKKYDPSSRISEARVVSSGEERIVFKGLPLDVLKLCDDSEPFVNQAAFNTVLMYSKKGYKCVGLASLSDDSGIHMDGIIAFIEPIRQESKSMLDIIRSLGIRPFALFHDGSDMAVQMAEKIGLGKVRSIGDNSDSSSIYFARELKEFAGLSGVCGFDKLPVLNALQCDGEKVAITGSSLVDSSALRHADISIVPESSIPAIRGIAHVQLKDYRLESIVNLFSDCQKLFHRINAWSTHEVIRSFFIASAFLISYFFFAQLPVPLAAMLYLGIVHIILFISSAQDLKGNVLPRMAINGEDCLMLSFGLISWSLIQFLGFVVLGLYVLHIRPVEMSSLVFVNMLIISQFDILLQRGPGHVWQTRMDKRVVTMICVSVILGMLFTASGLLSSALSAEGVVVAIGYSLGAFFIMDLLNVNLQKLLLAKD